MLSSITSSFELGERVTVQATISDGCGVVGTDLQIPYSAWPGWSSGTANCRIEGYVRHFAWPEGTSPAYVVQTVDDGWLYEFRPADLLPYLPQAKHIVALRERLAVLDRGPSSSLVPELPRPKFTRFSSTSAAHMELRGEDASPITKSMTNEGEDTRGRSDTVVRFGVIGFPFQPNSNVLPRMERLPICGNTPLSWLPRSCKNTPTERPTMRASWERVAIRNSWQLSCTPAFGPFAVLPASGYRQCCQWCFLHRSMYCLLC